MLVATRRLAFSLATQKRRLLDLSRQGSRVLSSTNVAGPAFASPASPPREDVTLVGPLGPLQNQDIKTSTEKLSPAFFRHRVLVPFGTINDRVSCETFLTPNAVVAGDVEIGDRTTVWYGAVIRGDENSVLIGAMTNIQEGTVITTDCEHTDISIDTDGTGGRIATLPGSVKIGDYVTIEPGCILRACTIENKVIIGAGSIICEGALVETGAIVGPGSIVPPGRRVPAGQLWAGRPIEFVKELHSHDVEEITNVAVNHYHRSSDHVSSCYPVDHYTMLHKAAKDAIEKNL